MKNKPLTYLFRLEDIAVNLILLLTAFLLSFEIIARNFFQTGIRNSTLYVQHLILAAVFLAGAITSRQQKHLTLAARLPVKEPTSTFIRTVVNIIAAAFTFSFTLSALSFTLQAFAPDEKIGFIPRRLIGFLMVFGFLVMAVRFITAMEGRKKRIGWLLLALIGALFLSAGPIATLFSMLSGREPVIIQDLKPALESALSWAAPFMIVILVVLAFFGLPVFVVLGGSGLLLVSRSGLPLEIVANQAYTVLTDYSIPAIPLFAAAGFFLSESKAGERLIEFFQNLIGWLPHGLIVVTVLVCAFFTTFTGGSGITIVALGGLLLQILMKAGYSKKFSVGLLTSSGSVGLLFPPVCQLSFMELLPGLALKICSGAGLFLELSW